jgi:hypothetical protein
MRNDGFSLLGVDVAMVMLLVFVLGGVEVIELKLIALRVKSLLRIVLLC